ncbi:TonB-dependent receptor family protein [Myxococcus xanthus]|uniref:TonB-dependent receptor family protein n=1 Tax=Myxococcus xanthus TaxID=34 RepID=UPI00112DB010|nr:TonB-dependent receptor [Myxococcus xanthus]QDE84669.1 ligand-gated channel protein [Myxococcus xanthus]QDE98834.1 ligand-gated channel protein [Myxococcus xanthus]QDF06494.1 ligand-gated channel protein [Myxococcus xanthus]
MALFEQKLMWARSWTLPALLLAWASPAAAQSEPPQDAAAVVPEPSREQVAPEPPLAPDTAAAPESPPAEPLAQPEPSPMGDAPLASEVPASEPLVLEPAPEAVEKKFESVVVGTSEARTSGSIHVLKPAQLERFERDDPAAILQTVPGVYARGEDGFGLRPNVGLRGVNPDRSKKVTLLEDGILFGPAPYSAPAAYYFPLATRMQSIRVLKGPSAIQQGPQTVGGSVDFLTRDIPAAESIWLDVAGGGYLYGKVHGVFGASTERAGFLLEGLHLRSDGFKELDTVGGNTGFTRNEWMAKGRYLLVPEGPVRQTLQVKLGYSDEDANETYLGLSDADFAAAPLRRYIASALDHMKWHRTQVVLSHELEAGGLAVTTSVYRHDLSRAWRKVNRFRGASIASVLADPTSARNSIYYGVLTGTVDTSSTQDALLIGPNDRTFVSQGLQSIARWSAVTGPLSHNVELGARFHYDSIDRLHTEDAYLMQGGQLVRTNEPTYTTANNRDSTHAVALHATDAIAWGPLVLTPGVRLEIIRSNSVNRLLGTASSGALEVLMPGMGVYGALTRELGLFAGAYRGFSPPAPGQPSAVLPEKSINYEGGARWTRRGERFEALGFFNDYSNLTDICTFSSGCLNDDLDRQTDAGKAFIYGLEIFGEKTFRPGGGLTFPVSLAYTFTRTRLREDFQSADPQFGNVRAGDELPYVPRHQIYATAGVESSWGGLALSAFYVDAMRERAGQGEAPPGELTGALLTFDVNANWNFSRWGQLYLSARNILDEQVIVSRRPYGARPNAPRTIILGAKLSI